MRQTDLDKYFNTFRMTPELLDSLLEKVRPAIEKKDTVMRPAIPAKVRLMVTLRYLTSGANFKVLEDIFRIHRTSITMIVPEVCEALWSALAKDHVSCPKTPEEWLEKAKRFDEQWNYPRGLGNYYIL